MTTKDIIRVGDMVAYKGERVKVMGIKYGNRSVNNTEHIDYAWDIHFLMINKLNIWGNFVKVPACKVVKLS
jgi:hypothetical protein